jgi:hypothetical protein
MVELRRPQAVWVQHASDISDHCVCLACTGSLWHGAKRTAPESRGSSSTNSCGTSRHPNCLTAVLATSNVALTCYATLLRCARSQVVSALQWFRVASPPPAEGSPRGAASWHPRSCSTGRGYKVPSQGHHNNKPPTVTTSFPSCH